MTTTLQRRLEQAKTHQYAYRPDKTIADQLRDVTFVALIGITGIGKSHLIPFVIEKGGPDFSELGNISTRATRPGDPPTFRGSASFEELLDKIEKRQLVSYVIHPSGDIYASDVESYQGKFVLLPTLTSALPQLEALGCFKRVVPIGVVADGATWQARFTTKQDDPKLGARLKEALICLEWLKANAAIVPIINNQTGDEKANAATIITLLREPWPQPPLPGTLELLDSLQRVVQIQHDQFMQYNQGKGEA